MTEQEKRKGGGGKLSRSETVTVRLDPKLRYLAELASRKQRRTLSSYIEWAIEDSLRSVLLYQGSGYGGDESVSVADDASRLWDVDQAERFVRLAIRYPELLTHEEQELWKLLQDSQLLQPAQSRRNSRVTWDMDVLEEVVLPNVRSRWGEFMSAYADSKLDAQDVTLEWVEKTKKEIADGKVYASAPPPARPSKPSIKTTFDDMDDDIPF